MNKFAIVLLLVFAFVGFSSAQSGRKVAPTPTPAPAVTDDGSYSDSISRKRSRSNSIPSLRSGTTGINPNVVPKSPNQAPVELGKSENGNEEDEVVRIETNLVSVPVSVFDRNGRYIPSLKQTDFKVFENGKEQEVAYFGTTEQPFTVVLLLDVSPSTEYKMKEIQDAAISFINQLKPQDSVMVIEFDQRVHVLAEPTNDRNKLVRAIRRADFGSGTSLYEAVDFALRKRLNAVAGRKAIVLFTDGVDTTSRRAGFDSTLQLAEEADSQVFTVYYDTYKDPFSSSGGVMSSPLPPIFGIPGIGGGQQQRPRGTSRRDYEFGKLYLKELAENTAGQVFPASADGGLEGAFAGIAEALRRQYTIGYYPEELGQVGQRKQIKVRVNRPNLVVRARDSYIVGANESPNTTTANSPNKFRESGLQ